MLSLVVFWRVCGMDIGNRAPRRPLQGLMDDPDRLRGRGPGLIGALEDTVQGERLGHRQIALAARTAGRAVARAVHVAQATHLSKQMMIGKTGEIAIADRSIPKPCLAGHTTLAATWANGVSE